MNENEPVGYGLLMRSLDGFGDVTFGPYPTERDAEIAAETYPGTARWDFYTFPIYPKSNAS